MLLRKLYLILLVSLCLNASEKPTRLMNYKELDKKLDEVLSKGDRNNSITILETILYKHADEKKASQHRLMLGNLYFEKKEYSKAGECYERYSLENPGTKEYAEYRSVLCKFYQSLGVHRDQTVMHKTLTFANQFLHNYPKSRHTQDIKDVVYTCEKKLIDHEFYVASFYLKQGKYQSAKTRLEGIRKNKLKKHLEIEPRLIYLEAKLAHKEKNDDRARELHAKLDKKFPKSQYSAMAKKMINKKGSWFLI